MFGILGKDEEKRTTFTGKRVPRQKSALDVEIMKNVRQLGDESCLCNLCGSVLRDWGGFRKHFRDQHFNSKARYLCPACKGTYKNRNSFAVHLSKQHKEIKGLKLETFKME